MTVNISIFFWFNDTATTEIYTSLHTLSLHDALPICVQLNAAACRATSACAKRSRVRGGKELLPERGRGRSHVRPQAPEPQEVRRNQKLRSEEHTSELQSLMRNSYDVLCLKKKKNKR